MFAHVLPVPFEAAHDAGIIRVTRTGARIYDDVRDRQVMLMLPERFPDQPFDAVSGDRIADDSCRDRQPQSCHRPRRRTGEHSKLSVGGAFRVTINAIKIRFVMKTLRRSERPGDCLQVRLLTRARSTLEQRQTVRRLRPFARRRARTARPDRVAIRARKPWVRAR